MQDVRVLEALEGLISAEEAAARLGVSRRTVRRRIEAGRLVGRKVGRDYVTHVSVLPVDHDEAA